MFIFGDFRVHHYDWLTYSGETDISGDPCYISNYLTQMVTDPWLWLKFLLFWIYLFFLMLLLFYNGFPCIRKFWSCCCFNFLWLFVNLTTGCPISLHSLWLFLCWLRRSLRSFLRCSMGGCSVRLLVLVNLCGFRLELMYVSLIERTRSSLNHIHGFLLLVLLP